MKYAILGELVEVSPLRRVALSDINAECKNNQSNNWRPVKSWAIGDCTYNELGETWKTNNSFRALIAVGE